MKQRPGKSALKSASVGANPLLAARNALEKAEKARQARRLDEAQRICESVLKQFPDYFAALHTIGMVHADKGDYRRALINLVQASMLNPNDASTLTVLSGVYLQLGSGTTALRTLDQARTLKPEDPNILATYGEICREEREYAAGVEALKHAVRIDPKFTAARYSLGICNYELGELEDAGEAFETLVSQGVSSVNLNYSLSHLPSRFVRSDVLELDAKLQSNDVKDEADFESMRAFSRAAAHNRAGRHDKAWDDLGAANGPMRDRLREDNARHRKLELTFLEGARKVQLPGSTANGEPAEQSSLFILGPSRCGKTTLERLLGCHPDVRPGYENPIVENAVRQAFQIAALPTRERIFELPPALDTVFRDHYREALTKRAGNARVFTNTHPAHIFSALRLAHVLPEARFVFMRRNRDDMALRIYMKRYRSGNAYAYGLKEVYEHLDWYAAMMDIVAAKLPDRVLGIDYADMIDNLKKVFDTVTEFCGLEPTTPEMPELGDDRDCALPYLEFIRKAVG